MKIAREGYPLIVAAAVVTILAFVFGWVAIGVILGICTLAIAAFFRDPGAYDPDRRRADRISRGWQSREYCRYQRRSQVC